MIRSLGLSSDLLVMRGLSLIEEHADRVVLRTPSEPDFWYGNMVIFRDGAVDPDPQIARFQADLPDASHVTLAWDAPGMTRAPGHDALAARGFDIDETDVLSLTDPLSRAAAPDGIAIRPVRSGTEWEQVTALQIEIGREDGFSSPTYAAFQHRRTANRRRQVAEGWALWLAAFDGDLLVGDLGTYVNDRTARYQAVETRASHRRQGICAALVTAAHDWAAQQSPGAVPVIAADRDGAAGRLYRRLGFALTETLVSATKGDKG